MLVYIKQKAPTFVDVFFYMMQRRDYDILNKDHWEEGLAKEDYACAEYDCGRYMIFYLDGQYHVYHDDMTVDEEDHFIGVFNSEEQVDEAMGRQ